MTRDRRTDHLGLDDADADLLEQRAARYAKRAAAPPGNLTEVVAFGRGAGRYATPLASLEEIRPLRALSLIPGASPVVPGVFHHRGELVSAHDLAAFVGGAGDERRSGAAPWVLIVEHHGERLGLLADEVLGVESIQADRLAPPPLTLGDRAACFQGIAEGETALLAPAALFSTPSFYSAF